MLYKKCAKVGWVVRDVCFCGSWEKKKVLSEIVVQLGTVKLSEAMWCEKRKKKKQEQNKTNELATYVNFEPHMRELVLNCRLCK